MTLGTVRVEPITPERFADLQAVLGGGAARCQCQRVRLGDREWWHMPPPAREAHLAEQVELGDGVIAYLDDDTGTQPVAWAAVGPRVRFTRILGSPIAWAGRNERKDDDTVWAIACLIVRPGFRGRGLTTPLVEGAVAFAQSAGARAIEGYPMLAPDGSRITWGELNVGPVSAFARNGFREVSRPSTRRIVMRREFAK